MSVLVHPADLKNGHPTLDIFFLVKGRVRAQGTVDATDIFRSSTARPALLASVRGRVSALEVADPRPGGGADARRRFHGLWRCYWLRRIRHHGPPLKAAKVACRGPGALYRAKACAHRL